MSEMQERLFSESIQANRELKEVVKQRVNDYDQKVSDLEKLSKDTLAKQQGQVDGFKGELDKEAQKIREDQNEFKENAHLQMLHGRVTHNQTLLPNAENNFPLFWALGAVKSAEIFEHVTSGTPMNDRPATVREFLTAMKADRTHFWGSFYIWRVTLKDVLDHASYGLYQAYPIFGEMTMRAIVKHESGKVPTQMFCTGLKAGEPAKLCGSRIYENPSNGLKDAMGYSHTTWRVEKEDHGESTILIALPAVVSGHVPDGIWGKFPSIIGDGSTTGQRAYD